MNLEIDYNIENEKWLNYIKEDEINSFMENIFIKVIEELKYNLNNGNIIEISIVFTDDVNIKNINNEYRGVNSPTNVLSFPLFENEFLKEYKKNPYISLGDIVLSIETIEKEAKEENIIFQDHLIHLIIHSLLHLFGFDHLKDDEADIMEQLEINILNSFNIKNPY